MVTLSTFIFIAFVAHSSAWVLRLPSFLPSKQSLPQSQALWGTETGSWEKNESGNWEVDVSDLGLTMDDLNAPLPNELLQTMETSGYDSTSRVPTVQDDACFWTETPSQISAILAIPGLRGQPSRAMSVLTSKNTISLTVFGRVVWSCILKGEVLPDSATFESRDGSEMIPVIEYTVKKADSTKRWDGFILQVGEDSIL